jgi:hypothetical protein
MSKLYSTRPSAFMGVEDEYTAYCLDEACAYITARLEKGETPTFEKHYTSFKDMYENMALS